MTHDKPLSMIAPCAADFVPAPSNEPGEIDLDPGDRREKSGAAVNIYPLRVNGVSRHIFSSICFRFIILVFRVYGFRCYGATRSEDR